MLMAPIDADAYASFAATPIFATDFRRYAYTPPLSSLLPLIFAVDTHYFAAFASLRLLPLFAFRFALRRFSPPAALCFSPLRLRFSMLMLRLMPIAALYAIVTRHAAAADATPLRCCTITSDAYLFRRHSTPLFADDAGCRRRRLRYITPPPFLLITLPPCRHYFPFVALIRCRYFRCHADADMMLMQADGYACCCY